MSDSSSPAPEWSNPYAPPAVPFSEPPAAPEPERALEPVKFGPRVGARLLDTGAFFLLQLVVGFFIGILAAIVAAFRDIPMEGFVATVTQAPEWQIWIASLTGSILFQTLLEGWHGCSPGKRLLGFVVLQEDGSPCVPFQALKREIAYFVDSLVFGLVAASRMSEQNRQQRLGDSWARTLVVYRRSVPARILRSDLRFAGVLILALILGGLIVSVPYLLRLAEL
jgi:uncharacterized RDD family membrane protein YckC